LARLQETCQGGWYYIQAKRMERVGRDKNKSRKNGSALLGV
jgi:hypothetical protein